MGGVRDGRSVRWAECLMGGVSVSGVPDGVGWVSVGLGGVFDERCA